MKINLNRSVFLSVITILLTFGLASCTVVPGVHMPQYAKKSINDMPIAEQEHYQVLKKVNFTDITAKTIVDLEKDYNTRSLGENNVANLYFNYRIGSKAERVLPDQADEGEYKVGPRDILNITVWEHQELTIPAGAFRPADTSGTVVGEDGDIYFPYVGVMHAAGRTVEAIRAELTEKLSKYIERVQLEVRVAAYRSQRVYVVGEVKEPGVQLVQDIPLTVLEAINMSGGVTDNADLRNITLTRGGKTYSINLLALYEGGDISQNIRLKHGDVLNVADNVMNKVFVMGELASAQGSGSSTTSFASASARSIIMDKGRITLAEAISDAGGISQTNADAARIFVFRSGLSKPEIFHLNAKSPDAFLLADRFPLQPRDLVYIDRAEGIRLNQIISEIAPTLQLLNLFVAYR